MIFTEAIKIGIGRLAEKHNLLVVALFGSQARGTAHKKSDIDIAVFGIGNLDRLTLGRELEVLFGREDLEIVDLREASPTMKYVVVRDGVLLYERSIGDFMKWKFHAIREWIDTAWLRRLRDRKLLEWASSN